MMQVTSDQWLSWLSLYFWPLLRVLALISTAPILSERSVPKRVKLGLAMMITFAIAPSLPANDVPVFSFFALWLAVQQILIGIALGFTMQFAFCRCANRWRNYRSANGAVICDICRSWQPSQYARFSAHHGYAGITAVPDI